VLIQARNLTIKKAAFLRQDWNSGLLGDIAVPTTALEVVFAEDDNNNEHTQYYFVSYPDQFRPTSDGMGLEATHSICGINKDCDFACFIAAVMAAGFRDNRISEDIPILEGL